MRKFTTILAIFALLLVSCRDNGPEKPEDSTQTPAGEYFLPMIETTDMHGHIVETNNAVHYRLAYIADKVEDYRAEGKDRLLLLDGGDMYQGASISNLTSGWPVYVSMDKMGYDAVALGNHEFDWGFENMVDPDATLPDYEWESNAFACEVPVVCANLYQNGSRVTAVRDFVIVEKTAVSTRGYTIPVRIGIVGFVPDYSGSIMQSKFAGQGFSIREDYSIANDIAKMLEDSGQCDATILLAHEAADVCAEKLGADSPFDLVAGGHSHQTKAGKTSWGLAYVQGGRFCENYGFAQLRFTVDKKGTASFTGIVSPLTRPVDAYRDIHAAPSQNANDLSEEILAVSDYAIDLVSGVMNDVIGYIDTGATAYDLAGSGNRACIMGNWMCDITRRIGGADVAFVNSGGLRTTLPLLGSPTRDITVANVYEIFPFDNHIYVYDLTWAEMLQVFEYSMTSGGSSLFTFMTGVDCSFTATDHGSYKTYDVYSLRKDGTLIYQDGKWTDDWASRSVKLAVSEYLATTERTDDYTGIPNPLLLWNDSARLLGCELVDNENAVLVLRAEAAASGGRLEIDTAPHMLLR